MEENPVIVTCVKNPFDALNSKETKTFPAGRPVREYLDVFYPALSADYDVVLSINGSIIKADDRLDLVCSPGMSLVFTTVPQGDQNTLRTVAMLAVVIIAAVATWYVGGAGGWAAGAGFSAGQAAALGAAAGAAVMVGGSLLVNALIPLSLPDASSLVGGENISQSASYGWGVNKNTDLQGGAAPVIYGARRITPPFIGRYVETINDQQYLNFLYLIADHAVDSITDVRINGNPVENYQNVTIETRLGTLNQAPIQFFSDTKEDLYVGAKLSTNWTTRQTTGNLVEGIGVAVSCPNGLYYQNDEGGLSAANVDIEIEYRKIGNLTWARLSSYSIVNAVTLPMRWSAGTWINGTWIEVEAGSSDLNAHVEGEIYCLDEDVWISNFGSNSDVHPVYVWRWADSGIIKNLTTVLNDYVRITGARTSPIRRVWFRDRLPAGQYEVRMRFKTAPGTNARFCNNTYFEFIEETIYDDFSYPGSSLMAVRALANDSLANDIQKVDCLATRLTVPVWTGITYVGKNAALPPWACYDMLHNSEYGGNVSYNRIPLAKWTEWETYCISKGLRSNIYFDTISNIRKALDIVSTAGRGTVVQMGSYFTCLVDKKEALPVQRFLFTPGNIIKDSFSYSYVPYTDRADAIEITYWDEDLDYENQTVTVTSDLFESNVRESKKTQISLYSVTNRQQAINHGKFMLNCNRHLSLVASWDADIDAIGFLPGEMVGIGWSYGGRIMEATATTVRCDREILLSLGKTYQIEVKHQADDCAEIRTIASAIVDPDWDVGNTYPAGYYVSDGGHSFICTQAITAIPAPATTDSRYWQPVGSAFNITLAWTSIPVKYALYSVGETGLTSKQVRVLSIGRSQNLRRKITALEYVEEVYDDVAVIPAPVPISDTKTSFLAAVEKWEQGRDGSGQSNVYLTWRGAALSYNVYYCESGEPWVNAGYTRVVSFCIEQLNAGKTYTFSVAKNGESPDKGAQISLTILGKDVPPEDVANFNATAQEGGAIEFAWDHITDIDRWGYEIREGLTWETATVVVDRIQENRTRYYKSVAGTHHFLIKAVDASGNYSITAAAATVTTNITALNIILTADELTTTPPAGGTFTNTIYAPTRAAIVLTCGIVDTDEPAWTDTTAGITDFDGQEVFTGSYISPAYDLGAKTVFNLRLSDAYNSAIRQVVDTTISTRTDRSYPNDTDTSVTSFAMQKMYCAFSDDNVTYTAWQLINGTIQVEARYLKIKVECLIDTSFTSFEWSSIIHSADVPDQKLTILNQAIDGAGTTFTLAGLSLTIIKEYYVGVTVLGSSSVWPVVNKSASQFTVKTFNSAGAVASNVDIEIRGY